MGRFFEVWISDGERNYISSVVIMGALPRISRNVSGDVNHSELEC